MTVTTCSYVHSGVPDTELLLSWQERGDREALGQLLRREIHELKRRVLYHGQGILNSPGSASDVINESIMRVLQSDRRPAFYSARVFSAYLWRAAQRLLIDRLRRRQNAHFLDNRSGFLENILTVTGNQKNVDRADSMRRISVVMSLIDDGSREILRQVYLKERSIVDVARSMGITPGAAKMRLFRAKKVLRKKLDNWSNYLG